MPNLSRLRIFFSDNSAICLGSFGYFPCIPLYSYNTYGSYGFALLPSTKQIIENNIRTAVFNSDNKSIKALGAPYNIMLSPIVTSQGAALVNVRVLHSQGISEWTVSISPDGSLVNAFLTDAKSFIQENSNRDYSASTIDNAIQKMSPPNYDYLYKNIQRNNSASNSEKDVVKELINQYNFEKSAPPREPIVDRRVVEFLVATTRKRSDGINNVIASYGGDRGDLSYAVASVRIPEDHKIGRIELPGSWSLFGITWSDSQNDEKHFRIKKVLPVSDVVFDQIIRNKNSKKALIFVHGFNSSFENSILRNAQIVWDLQYDGISVIFSWPSKGSVVDYLYDKDSTISSRGAFVRLIEKLRKEHGIEEVNILAHSMGNLLVLEALAGYSQSRSPFTVARLLMAAPDVDRDSFLDLAPKAKSIVNGMTLYASAADKALAISRQIAGGIPRAGDVPAAGPIVMQEVVETLDITAIGEEIFGLNHDIFGSSRDLIEDISAILRLNQKSPRLAQIRAVPEPPEPVRYWRYAR
ncbi:alpha/beta hydrolase [Xanthobacter autotrophicus]|uniref:alpha/beta hydrolase n=1 Tax=Xanthobacter autotrophicus TaxID=280 RepID=UPI001E52BFDC|nr:alpha/beta hydrolase [Xanthobacter autotrophicus]UDQ90772.1 alpha/beta hydrolase [Xanthobacter autotrophicus]